MIKWLSLGLLDLFRKQYGDRNQDKTQDEKQSLLGDGGGEHRSPSLTMSSNARRRFAISLLMSIGLSAGLIGGCGNPSNSSVVRVGVISGPESELMTVAQQVAQKQYGLHIKLVKFDDYLLPNTALNDGSLDANMFQHQPYLEEAIRQHQYDFAVIGKTFTYPMGIYSHNKRISTLDRIPLGATVAIPNDPTNEGRALLLLENAGLIQLDSKAGFLATLKSITDNPKQLRFKELDAAQLTRVLVEVDLAVINTNYAILADLSPKEDALFRESANSPYANILVANRRDQQRADLLQLVEALHSSEVIEAADRLFKGQAIQAWKEDEHH